MGAKRRSAVDTLDRMTIVVHAASKLLVQVAACMRQVVSVAGWLVLLVSTVSGPEPWLDAGVPWRGRPDGCGAPAACMAIHQ